MKDARRWVLVGVAVMAVPARASAGLLDKLNEAAKKMEQTSQTMQQHAQPQPVGQAQSGGSLSAALGATDLHGLSDFNGCMAQASGTQERLTAQVLQRKLERSTTLSPDQRRAIEQDIQWLNATAAGQRGPAPDPRNPQRYLLELTDAEQMEISGANNRFASEVHEKCEAQFGGMSQFADPAGRRPAPIDVRVALPDLLHAAPAPEAQRPSPAAQRSKCLAAVQGLRWQLMAERMEQKLRAMPNISGNERIAWEQDIATVRAAASGGATTMPQSPDPNNPMRYMTRLAADDQVALNQEYAARSQAVMASCNGGSAANSNWTMATSRTAQARAEAKANAPRGPAQAADAANAAQAWLDAHPAAPSAARPVPAGLGATRADYLERGGVMACFDRIKGFRAKQMADRLSAKRGDVTDQDRAALEQWIIAWRAAEQTRVDEPTPPDPANPQGYFKFLSKADQQEMNMAYSAAHNTVLAECNAMDHMGLGARSTQ